MRNIDGRTASGLEYIELAPGFIREVVDAYEAGKGRGPCRWRSRNWWLCSGRSLQILQDRRSSPRIWSTKDRDIQGYQIRL